MHDMKYVYIVLAVIIVGYILMRCSKMKEGLDGMPMNIVPVTREINEKRGFLPSHQFPTFQNLPPLTTMENDYHTYVHNDCNGNYADLKCRQKAYIKAVKAGSTDKADLMCWRFAPEQGGNEDLYYECLDGIYGNYIWMDRFTGASPCHCTNGSFPYQGQGAGSADGTPQGGCYCPKKRSLNQRWPLDIDGNIVNKY